MVVDVDGLKVDLIDIADRQVIHIKEGDGYEPESLRAWAQMVRPATVAFDVGAYTGLYSILAARRGANVVAFEPMPANHWRLHANMRENKVKLDCQMVVVSDHEGLAVLHYNPNVALTTGASAEPGNPLHHDTIRVRCVTLDSLAYKNVSAIKIDVERHELAVLRGALRTIERAQPSLLIETLDTEMRDQILNLLPSYQASAVLDRRNTLFVPKT